MNVDGKKGDRENPPAGVHMGRLVGIYDIGTQPAFKPGDSPKAQIIFLHEITSGPKMKSGANFIVSQYVGRSNHSNGGLCPVFTALTGIALKPGKADKQNKGFYYELPADFQAQFKGMLGKPEFISLVPKDANGGVKVSSISAPMAGVEVPMHTTALGWLDFDDTENFSSDWMAAPKWIQEKAAKSLEMTPPPAPAPQAPAQRYESPAGMQNAEAPAVQQNPAGVRAPALPAGAQPAGAFEDEIPY